ncbi:MAG: Ig-like domain-containing protein, partial [Deltaproteobacteria bacterium]|nr:Ig-like domain-containing protein [Deltaproteobacteria bacterium]
PPTIVNTSPAHESRAPISTEISVIFSEAMDHASVESAFDIDPYVSGTFSWSENTMIFTPDEDLTPDISYTVTIDTSAQDLAGNPLASPYSWSFTTYTGTTTITCPVMYDTYVMFGGMGAGKGYPHGSPSPPKDVVKAGAVTICDARALFKFDLSNLAGVNASDIVKAEFCYHMLDTGKGFMALGAPARAGTPMYGFIHALNTTTYEYNELGKEDPLPDPTEPFFWDETTPFSGPGYVWMKNKPGYVRGAPMILAIHDTGPNTPGSIDITEIVRGWVGGRYKNNGIGLKDHDDRSYLDSEYGDGYSWFIASKDDSTRRAYLSVEVNVADRVRIKDKPIDLPVVPFGETMDFEAQGGDDLNYTWQVIGPDNSDITNGVLSSVSGNITTFTPPAMAGLYRIIVTDGEDSDNLFVGVQDPDSYIPPDELYGLSLRLFPLFMGSDIDPLDQEAIYRICADIIEDIGASGMLGEVTLTTPDGKKRLIGGTGKGYAAKTSIAIVEDPYQAHQVELIDEDENLLCAIEIPEGGISGVVGDKIYVTATDTGISSWGNASRIYNFSIYDESIKKLDSSLIANVSITLSFNRTLIKAAQLEDGTYSIVYVEDTGLFFAPEELAPKESVPAEDITYVDYDEGWVEFQLDHLSSFGLQAGGEAMAMAEGVSSKEIPASLGSGCFITTTANGFNIEPLSSAFTVVLFVLFAGIIPWGYRWTLR